MSSFSITGRLVDVHAKEIYPATLHIEKGRIVHINRLMQELPDAPYILPGFIDSHVHIESSMLVPSEFARLAVVHGTVATISDPHEIANVCGMEGVEYMIENGKTVPFKFNFGAPSCVPATSFETAGAVLGPADIETLLQREEVRYLSEMMNFPGVLFKDEEVMKKIAIAKRLGKPVDGHAPGLRGEKARQYIEAGISTDHECFTREEALDKLQMGMKVIIREGSAAKNFEALIDLLHDWPDQILFCSDDKHPDSLVLGHINQLCASAVAKGIDLFNILQAACVNPVNHYQLEVGLLRTTDAADFILVHDLQQFEVIQTYINGERVADNGLSLIGRQEAGIINQFSCSPKSITDFETAFQPDKKEYLAIEALDGQLITPKFPFTPIVVNGKIVTDTKNDLLKIAVVNRYRDAPVTTAFIKNFGLKRGALASSVAHDSHNIVAVGVDDESLCRAVNLVIGSRGGVSAACPADQENNWKEAILPLSVAGLMSNDDGYQIAADYTAIDKMTKEELGSSLASPFMTLSFMALLVIPHLKLSDKGLFDGDRFSLIG